MATSAAPLVPRPLLSRRSSWRPRFLTGTTPISTIPQNGLHLSATTGGSSVSRRRGRRQNPDRPLTVSPVMEWQDCSAEMEIDVPCSVAYDCYSDRESIPLWMPFIYSVKVLEDKPDLSRWSLKYEVFGQNVEFSWLARNFQPIRNQKNPLEVSGRPSKQEKFEDDLRGLARYDPSSGQRLVYIRMRILGEEGHYCEEVVFDKFIMASNDYSGEN